jgi:hypothetical protein
MDDCLLCLFYGEGAYMETFRYDFHEKSPERREHPTKYYKVPTEQCAYHISRVPLNVNRFMFSLSFVSDLEVTLERAALDVLQVLIKTCGVLLNSLAGGV